MGPMIAVGLQQLRVIRQNPPVGSEPPRAIRPRDKVTQRVASSWHIRDPIEGTRHPQGSYLSLDQEVSFMPLYVGWHLVIRVFPPGITQKSLLKPPGQDLMGGIGPCVILWRGTCPSWLSPTNGDPGSTQILTWHYGVKSQTVSQLMNSATTPTGQVLIVQPLQVIKILTDGVRAQATPPFDNPNRIVGLH
jgi:hypothetical protein